MSINNLAELIQPYLNRNGMKFVSYGCKNLLPAGENYGSVMLVLNIKVKTRNGEEKSVNCVAKTVPPSETVWHIFNVPVTFKKEIAHYNTVVPTLDEYGKERGIDNLMHFFAKCYGARISVNPEQDVVDKDAVLILENLKEQGYSDGNRFTGCDMETAKLILKDMATLHASAIAYKLTKPEEFKTKILPHLNAGFVFVPSDEILDNLASCIQKFASRNPKCVPLLSRVGEGIRKGKVLLTYSEVREPFATIAHTDMWTNNMMIKVENGKPARCIFLDFQGIIYGSPARDLLFFLYSSVELEVLKAQIDQLIKYYYDQLLLTIQKLQCDVSNFSYKLFMEEVEEIARELEFSHLIFLFTPLFTLKGEAKELTEWTIDHLVPENEETLHKNYYERLYFTILDFGKRNWI